MAPIRVRLSTYCVQRGQRMTITVNTLPKSTAGYQAVYAGEKSGAAPPLGDGYGGNAGGRTFKDGSWSDTWVVAPTAPVGPARVDVVVATPKGYGTNQTHFRVVAVGASC